MNVVCIVGMPGSGKSEAARVFEESGFIRVRFGDVTDAEVRKRGLDLNEKNERLVREMLRQEYGMAAYAQLNLPAIDNALMKSDVVIDGLYSWEEYIFLRSRYAESFTVVAVCASPKTRYTRLSVRTDRWLTIEEASARDEAEIQNLNKGGPIAMANFTIINESFLDDLERETKRIIGRITE